MNRSYLKIIEPIIEVSKPKHILEIGANKGENTIKILEFCKKNNAKLSVIDPFPQFDNKLLEVAYSNFFMYQDLSLKVMREIGKVDLIILDGDHNYYTVYNELHMIESINRDAFPVILMHDVSWPYARRDMYYNPDNIPKSEINEYEKKGLHSKNNDLVKGGYNESLYNAKRENTEKNGVLTAIEDFKKESYLDLSFSKIEYKNGIGCLCLATNIDVITTFDEVTNNKELTEILENQYNDILSNYTLYRSRQKEEKKVLAEKIQRSIGEMSSIKALFKDKELDFNKLLIEKGSLLHEVSSLAEQSEKKEKEINDLIKEINNQRVKSEMILVDLEDTKFQMNKLTAQVSQNNQEMEHLLTVIDDKEQEISKYQADADDLNEINEKRKKVIEATNLIISSWENEINKNFHNLTRGERFSFEEAEPSVFSQRIESIHEESICNKNEIVKLNNAIINSSKEIRRQESLRDNTKNEKALLEKLVLEVNSAIITNDKYKSLGLIYEYTRHSEGYRDDKIFDDQSEYQGNRFARLFKYLKTLIFGGIKNSVQLNQNITLLKGSNLFDVHYYLMNNPDVYYSGYSPYIHFIYYGGFEERNPSIEFDVKKYLKVNDDVKISKMNPLLHYLRFGVKEGREIFSNKRVVEKLIEVKEKNEPKRLIVEKNKDYPLVDVDIDESLKVSVIMPTFNRKEIISRSIDSVLRQNYKNKELLIIDDGSSDGTESFIASKYKEELNRGEIKYFIIENHGVSYARNIGLSYAAGDVIAYLDSDNEWLEGYLEKITDVYVCNTEIQTIYTGLCVYDKFRDLEFQRVDVYNRKRLLDHNFIDLNIFSHVKELYHVHGGFDTSLKRLVDWELIIRYTKSREPFQIKEIFCKYYLDDTLNNISNTVPLEIYKKKVHNKHTAERIKLGLCELKIGYVLWDYPSFSQTFVHSEIEYLLDMGYKVNVYYKVEPDKVALLDYHVDSFMVNDSVELTELLLEHEVNYLHAHFLYPAGTLLVYPAALNTGIKFSITTHAVDIFHENNIKRNKLAEIANHHLCNKIFTISKFHKQYHIDMGARAEKVAVIKQSMNFPVSSKSEITEKLMKNENKEKTKIICITRFVEKKGIEYLINAAKNLKVDKYSIDIYGYGPMEEDYKKLIEENNLLHVKLLGPLTSKDEIIGKIKEADLFALPCIQAENGDMDGIPTVLVESMALGTPVVSTKISGIGDLIEDRVTGFYAGVKDSASIVKCIDDYSKMDFETKEKLCHDAANHIECIYGTDKTVESYLDVWLDREVTYFMVTYVQNNESFDNFKAVYNQYRKFSNRRLIIVDNDSIDEFRDYLKALEDEDARMQLVLQNKNTFCGNASNTALNLIHTPYAIYICSNEGFILSDDFEEKMLKGISKETNIGLAGDLAYSPKYFDGDTYSNLDNFSSFRNQEFALTHPERLFRHVQGGMYIIDMNVYEAIGGFNDKTPHNSMDVEYSYFMESEGYKLGKISGLVSCTKATLPTAMSRVDSNTIGVHPLKVNELSKASQIKNQKQEICPKCGSVKSMEVNQCDCGLKSKNKEVYRFLSQSEYGFRDIKIYNSTSDVDLSFYHSRMFSEVDKSEEADLLISNSKDVNKFGLYENDGVYVYKNK